ncbi:MAG: hypothetical protein ACRDL4_09325 [Thermoleophilaceae bacterium]
MLAAVAAADQHQREDQSDRGDRRRAQEGRLEALDQRCGQRRGVAARFGDGVVGAGVGDRRWLDGVRAPGVTPLPPPPPD